MSARPWPKRLAVWAVQFWLRVSRPATLGARIVAIDPAGRVCLVRHTYTEGWHLPGGGVERGESCLAAAIKEGREEAGLLIAPEALELASIHSNFAIFPGDHVVIYHARDWTTVPVDNAREIAECGFFAPDALPDGTTPGTRRRIAEALGAPVRDHW